VDLWTLFLIFVAGSGLCATGNNKTISLPLIPMKSWPPGGLKGNLLQKRKAPGSYFATFSTNRLTIDLQHPQKSAFTQSFFAAILQARQAASTSFACSNIDSPNLYLIAIPGHIRLLFCLSIEIRIAFAILYFWM
jgi:hypothetical protein